MTHNGRLTNRAGDQPRYVGWHSISDLVANMIVKLSYTNNLPIPVTLMNNQGTGQPLLPRQSLEMTFDMEPGPDGVADLILVCYPEPPGS